MEKLSSFHLIQSPPYFSSHCLVLSTGILSSMLSLSMMITSVVVLVTDQAWHLVMQQAEVWLQENHWDITVSRNSF